MKNHFKKKLLVLSLVACILFLNFIPFNAISNNEIIGIGEEVVFISHNETEDMLASPTVLPTVGLMLLAGALHYSATWAAQTQQDPIKVADDHFVFSDRHQNSDLQKQIAFNNLD